MSVRLSSSAKIIAAPKPMSNTSGSSGPAVILPAAGRAYSRDSTIPSKSVSQGFATLDYELSGYQPADLVKLDVLIASDKIDALSQIIPRALLSMAKKSVDTLQNVIPRQNFEVPIQAAIGSHILARAISRLKKRCHCQALGGDQTRKDKLLKKQKKAKPA